MTTTKNVAYKEKIGKYRWIICTLLLFSTTINYMDRNVIGYLKEYFCSPEGFRWSNADFSYVTSVFTAFYALTTIFAGILIDKIGTKLGLAISLVVWSVFGILNAFVGQMVLLHMVVRSLFGVGEAGNFPASIKTVAEWFPKKERALATSIFNSGSNIGAMLTALFVPWCIIYFGGALGWKMAFILTGSISFLWLIFWFVFYDTPEKLKIKGSLTAEEYQYIHVDDLPVKYSSDGDEIAEKKVSWGRLLTYRQTWSFFVGKFMTDGVWWFLLFWLPDYLKKQFGMTTQEVMLPTFIVYGVAIVGAVFSGSLPLIFINKGWNIYKARMTSMLIIAFFPLLLIFTQFFGNVAHFGSLAPVFAVGIICIAAAAHCGWAANVFTTVSDMFPKKAVASVTGIGAAAGGLGGVLLQLLPGYLTDLYHNTPSVAYNIMFIVCAILYLIAWLIMKLLVSKESLITDL